MKQLKQRESYFCVKFLLPLPLLKAPIDSEKPCGEEPIKYVCSTVHVD